MIVLYGTAFFGKVDNLKEQWVETKFFYLFIPLFPLSSMLVTKSEWRRRHGMDISLNRRSIIAAYARIYLALLSAFTFYINSASYESSPTSLIVAILLAAAWLYFMFVFGNPKKEDTEIREKVAKCIGLYALPDWFDHNQTRIQLRGLKITYKEKYGDSDWRTDLAENVVPIEKRPMLYALALFNCMAYGTPEDQELFFKADELYTTNPI